MAEAFEAHHESIMYRRSLTKATCPVKIDDGVSLAAAGNDTAVSGPRYRLPPLSLDFKASHKARLDLQTWQLTRRARAVQDSWRFFGALPPGIALFRSL